MWRLAAHPYGVSVNYFRQSPVHFNSFFVSLSVRPNVKYFFLISFSLVPFVAFLVPRLNKAHKNAFKSMLYNRKFNEDAVLWYDSQQQQQQRLSTQTPSLCRRAYVAIATTFSDEQYGNGHRI